MALSTNNDTTLVLVEADTPEKLERLGTQAANHVFLVIHTDDCRRYYKQIKSRVPEFAG